jgi:hypothetical protein
MVVLPLIAGVLLSYQTLFALAGVVAVLAVEGGRAHRGDGQPPPFRALTLR